MFLFAARNDTKTLLEFGIVGQDLSNPAILAGVRAALCANAAIPDATLSILVFADTAPEAVNLQNGGSYSMVWSGTVLTGIDISAETSKRIVKVTASKALILADGADSTVVTIQVWKADGSAIDTAVNTTVDVPVITPDGRFFVRTPISSGQASKTLTTTKVGHWVIPADVKRFANVRIQTVAEFDSVMPIASLG